jgi:hypothetical protein
MKIRAMPFAALLGIIILEGCAMQTAVKKEEPPYVPPSFSFTPPSTAPAGSADVTIAIVNASYSENQPWADQWPFTDVSKNMSLDFQQIVTARGFPVRGPFGSYDEMTFPDKKGADLVLQPTLEIRLEMHDLTYRQIPPPLLSLQTRPTYSMQGKAAISGRVTLSIMESLSKERMWFKTVELPNTVIPWEGEKRYASPLSKHDLDFSDPGIAKPLGKTMEGFYAKVMQAAWNYLDPDEMKLVKKQAEEIKKKKVY